ncbi:MAG: hypothetical protein AB1805_04605 [Nitrospirota bacterium]
MGEIVEYDYWTRIVLPSLVVILLLADTLLYFIIKAYKPMLPNKYYRYTRDKGFVRLFAFKLAFTALFFYSMRADVLGSGYLLSPVLLYGIVVIQLLIDFIKWKSGDKWDGSI